MKKHGFSIWNILGLSLGVMIICGILYPLAVTAVGQGLFNKQADGSLVYNGEGKVVGSKLIGQSFDEPGYFHSRVSSINYDAAGSGSPNYAPSNPEMIERTIQDTERWLDENPEVLVRDLPIDLVTNSASGLDPHISPEAALAQVPRVAENTGMDESTLRNLIEAHTQEPSLGMFGSPGVNVLTLNLAINEK
ncbi:potassium-transporting ATPase subunit KdpC [Halobacillus sp. K22]|uniref:potassium-transporting ATPase subunit KdpC n=1 Tax=Halobacillus sp. K22 TaxID=3457431 RepID=UPI003FCEBA4D